MRLLKRSPYFPEWVKTPDSAEATPSDGELYIGSLILHNLMLIQFNAHEVSRVISLFPFLFFDKTSINYRIESLIYLCVVCIYTFTFHSQISELAVPKGSNILAKAKSKFIGGGVYSTVSLFNHSCNPGIIR